MRYQDLFVSRSSSAARSLRVAFKCGTKVGPKPPSLSRYFRTLGMYRGGTFGNHDFGSPDTSHVICPAGKRRNVAIFAMPTNAFFVKSKRLEAEGAGDATIFTSSMYRRFTESCTG